MNLKQNQLEHYMKQAISLAQRAKGQTSPNPLVGSILLDNEYNIITQDYHKQAGKPHAEALVLKQAGDKAQNSMLFVTLEPCVHHGKTPPCVDKIIESGVKTVIIGTQDPNPLVNGQGIKKLRDNNIEVITGVCENECKELNKEFFYWIKNKRPWVTLKIAGSLNGKITSDNKYITSDKARQHVHLLRSQHDAMLTTAETVIQDNCLLTVRNITPQPEENKLPSLFRRGAGGEGLTQPLRIVIDRNSRCTPEYNIFQDNSSDVWLFSKDISAQNNYPQHVKVIKYSGEFTEILDILAQENILSVMLETGSKFNSYILENKLFNELIYYIHPETIISQNYLDFCQLNNSLELELYNHQVINNKEFVFYLR